ncbi:DUF2800 domain-containing protein [Corynebacterium marambiense]
MAAPGPPAGSCGSRVVAWIERAYRRWCRQACLGCLSLIGFGTVMSTAVVLVVWLHPVTYPRSRSRTWGAGGEFCPGSWCQLCKISAICWARAETNLAPAKLEFAPQVALTDDEIAHVLA